MSIEWLRDLAIFVLGFGAVIAIIFMVVLALLIYRKISPILDSCKGTARTVRNISSTVEEEVAEPLIRIASVIQGIRQVISMVSRFSKDKEGK